MLKQVQHDGRVAARTPVRHFPQPPYIPPMTYTDPRRFLYRSDALTPDAALRLTADALRPLRRRRALPPIYRLRILRLRRRAAEDGRFRHPGGLRASRRIGRDHRLRPRQRAFRGRHPPRRRDDGGARSGQRPAPGAAAPDQRDPLHRFRPAQPGPLRAEGGAVPGDRRRGPGPRSAGRPGRRSRWPAPGR